ncbi:protein YgfX [Sodalis praecaptivus]|uniref:protein YgfX n=1 Tax=Sodalis praecaptivus TaxID=1239307 RepID=UPI00280AB988|nr:protein YgfX [Sodalis praecaptivus]
MALWRCDIRVSWRTQLCSLAFYGILIMLILLSPWPENYGLVWLTLVLVVVFECIRSQRNIMSCRGELVLMSDSSIQWHREEWTFTRKAWMLKGGVLLSLRKAGSTRRRRLWLAADSMDGREFRHLRQLLARQTGS